MTSSLVPLLLLQAKDDPWFGEMQRGQTPEWFLRCKAMVFMNVGPEDVVVSAGLPGDGMLDGSVDGVEWCVDCWVGFSMGLRI